MSVFTDKVSPMKTMLALTVSMFLVAVPAQACHAQAEPKPATQFLGLSEEEGSVLLQKVGEAQHRLRTGREALFELLSGSIASYPMASKSPRDAFLEADFDQPWSVERLPSPNPSWHPHRITILPDGPGADALSWEVEVVLGFYGDVQRIEMLYKPVPPF